MEKVFKGFKILEKEKKDGGKWYQLSIENLNGKTAEVYLTDNQKDLIDLIGFDNCFLFISERKSKDNRPYKTITLKVGEDEFDFFPRDRAFISLSLAIAKKKAIK